MWCQDWFVIAAMATEYDVLAEVTFSPPIH
jgi:hypothetical protein